MPQATSPVLTRSVREAADALRDRRAARDIPHRHMTRSARGEIPLLLSGLLFGGGLDLAVAMGLYAPHRRLSVARRVH